MHLQEQAASPYLGQVNMSTHLIYILHWSVHFQPQFEVSVTKAFYSRGYRYHRESLLPPQSPLVAGRSVSMLWSVSGPRCSYVENYYHLLY